MDLGHIYDVADLRLYVSGHLGTPVSHAYVYGQEVGVKEEGTLGGTGPTTLPVPSDACTLCTCFGDVSLNMLRSDELATRSVSLAEFKDHPYDASHSDLSCGRLINPACADVVALSTPSHELLYISDLDSNDDISQVVERRFKHEELTILCPKFTGPISKPIAGIGCRGSRSPSPFSSLGVYHGAVLCYDSIAWGREALTTLFRTMCP